MKRPNPRPNTLLTICLTLLALGVGAQEPTAPSMDPGNWDHVEKLDFPVRWNLWRCQEPGVKPDLSNANLSAENEGRDNLMDLYLRDVDLRGADMRGASLSGADMRGADLRGAKLRGANLSGADLRGANLEGAELEGAYYNDATLFTEGFDPAAKGLKMG